MSYSLENLAADIRRILISNDSDAGRREILTYVSRALLDQDFITRHLQDREPGGDPREILFEDAEIGFCICGHVYAGQAVGEPHDHGPSWAIYGQAAGETEMTDWRIVSPGDKDSPIRVEAECTYILRPGDARYYPAGAIHSPNRAEPVKLVRIEGENLDKVTRSWIEPADTTA